jgi:hypothetical protein
MTARFQQMEADMSDNTDEPIRRVPDPLESLKAEIAEAMEMMRPHFPNRSEDSLRHLAEALRSERYRSGRWPDFVEMARKESSTLAAVITTGIAAHRSRSNGEVISPIDFAKVIGSTIEVAEAVCNTLGKLGGDELERGEPRALASAVSAEHERILQARPPKPVTF